ncbi:MAG: 30S ribosomal protein THX [Rhodanobacteraceae bacterium]
MGRGDRKTTKGKIAIRSYGNVRPHKKTLTGQGVTKPVRTPAKPHKTTAAPAKAKPVKATKPAKPAARKTTARAPAKKTTARKKATPKKSA